jgi:uncharacterized protein YbaR (Trm112 family)
VIIFGYRGGKRKDLGEALPMRCPRCNNSTFYRSMTVTSWLSLFFIPVIPLKRRDYLVCPVCTRALELRKDQREMAARLVELTTRYRAGEIADADYQAQLRALTGAGGMGQAALPETPVAELPPPPTQ